MELRATHPVRFIPIDVEVAKKANELNNSVFPGEITPGTYDGQDESIPTVLVLFAWEAVLLVTLKLGHYHGKGFC